MNNNVQNFPKNWRELLTLNGHFAVNNVLDDTALSFVKSEDWDGLDQYFQKLTQKDGELYKFLKQFCDFKEIEFIISIRDANNPWEEDGIWHDDGSRKLAFSLSLTKSPHLIEGGHLEIRKKQSETSFSLSPFEYGKMIIFATGVNGFEHKINQVKKGKRIIIAGWCE